MTELNPEWTKRARHVLVDEGADSEGGWHSWRCFDKERYPEPCDCTAEAAERALSAVAPAIAAKAWDEAAEEAHALGWLHDYAKDDLIARNPHRSAQAAGFVAEN